MKKLKLMILLIYPTVQKKTGNIRIRNCSSSITWPFVETLGLGMLISSVYRCETWSRNHGGKNSSLVFQWLCIDWSHPWKLIFAVEKSVVILSGRCVLAALDGGNWTSLATRPELTGQADTQLQRAVKGKRFPRLRINKYINQALSVIAN